MAGRRHVAERCAEGIPAAKAASPTIQKGRPCGRPFAKLALTERLKPLLDYDLKHGTELVKTLEVYFNNCRNSVNTASDLFIHRNTLLYRLEQISKILDLDLNNNEQVLIIQLALKALIMVK